MINLDPTSEIPKYQQIYEQFRTQILDGTYQAGAKLPPIRVIAQELGVSRNTIETAYIHLSQNGFVTSRAGSGFLVEDPSLTQPAEKLSPIEGDDSFFRRLNQTNIWDQDNRYAGAMGKTNAATRKEKKSRSTKSTVVDFSYGDLQIGSFPVQVWRRITSEILSVDGALSTSSYSNTLGEKSLREHIAQMIRINSGVNCHPSQVVLQAGTQSSLGNLLLIFDPLRDVIAMEEPGRDDSRSVFENARYRLFPLPVYENQDAFIDALYNSHAKLAYVTPSNQFPCGQVMPIQTKQRLLKWAITENAYIIEDDYCREFRYSTRALPSLQSLDQQNRVIYMGTFSKSLSPALRLSYLVLPPDLLFEWNKLFGNYSSEVPWLSQAVLAGLIEKGYWNKHVRKCRAQNKRKHAALINALQTHMGDRIDVMQSGSGLHVLVGIKDGRHQNELIATAAEAGIIVYETNRFWMSAHHPMENYILVGFSAILEQEIESGIARLAKAWFK